MVEWLQVVTRGVAVVYCYITLSIWCSEGQIGAGTPLVHQLPANATIENRMRVASSPSLSVKPVAAVESNVAPSVSSPARTRPKWWGKLLTRVYTMMKGDDPPTLLPAHRCVGQ